MPMIIDTRALCRLTGGCAGALGLWFGGMAALALVIEPDAVIAFGATPALYRTVAESDGLLLGAGRGFITTRAAAPGFVRRLYASGAWIVWPALGAGCGRRL